MWANHLTGDALARGDAFNQHSEAGPAEFDEVHPDGCQRWCEMAGVGHVVHPGDRIVGRRDQAAAPQSVHAAQGHLIVTAEDCREVLYVDAGAGLESGLGGPVAPKNRKGRGVHLGQGDAVAAFPVLRLIDLGAR